MAKFVENKKNEFGELIKKLESHEFHYGNLLIEQVDVLSSISYYLEEVDKDIDYEKFYAFIKSNRGSVQYIVNRNIGWYVSEIFEGIGEDMWNEFGEEILNVCSINSES